MIPFKFYAITTEQPQLRIETAFFKEAGTLCILWGYKGLFKIVSHEVVANMVSTLADHETLSPIAKNMHVGIFFWEDGITVDPKVAKILLSNQQ